MFHQQIIFETGNQEFVKICKEHPNCDGCPLLTQDIQLQSGLARCETGRNKGENN